MNKFECEKVLDFAMAVSFFSKQCRGFIRRV